MSEIGKLELIQLLKFGFQTSMRPRGMIYEEQEQQQQQWGIQMSSVILTQLH